MNYLIKKQSGFTLTPKFGVSRKRRGFAQTPVHVAGFTLIEITVVIFIITMGLMGILALATQSIKVSNFNKNNLIASQLAQEGLELVRNRRDNNWLVDDGRDWNNDIGAGGGGGSSAIFTLDVNDNKVSVANIDSSQARLIIFDGKYVNQGAGGTQTPFYRIVTTNYWDDYLNVECWVRWRDSGGVHDYKASTVLYNWK